MFVSPLKDLVVRNDDAGDGAFGARRTRQAEVGQIVYRHKGVDLVGMKGDKVVAPCAGRVIRIGQAYSQPDRFAYKVIEMKCWFGTMKFLYVRNVVGEGSVVQQGTQIGFLLDVGELYPGTDMVAHLHWEIRFDTLAPHELKLQKEHDSMWPLVNPMMFFKCGFE